MFAFNGDGRAHVWGLKTRLENGRETKARHGVVQVRKSMIVHGFHLKFDHSKRWIDFTGFSGDNRFKSLGLVWRPANSTKRDATMVVEKPLGQMGINRIQFETMEFPPGFNVFSKPAEVSKGTKRDFQNLRMMPHFQVQTGSGCSNVQKPKSQNDFGLLQPVLQPVQFANRSMHMKRRVPRNETSMGLPCIVHDPSQHAGTGLVFMNVEKPALNHDHAVPQGPQGVWKVLTPPTSGQPAC